VNFPKRRNRISDWRRPRGVVGPKGFMAFSDDQATAYAEVHLAGTDQREEQGFVVKEILRTGTWKVTPTRGGIKNVPLTIVRRRQERPEKNIISLSELVSNFKALDMRVQIPLSDDDDDHKNITATNTGYVRDIWIVDSANGSKLVAKMEFTEPDVKDKVLRGTYADVSCGIPWQVVSRGSTYGTSLEHVAITNRPFIDGLGGFIAMSGQGPRSRDPALRRAGRGAGEDRREDRRSVRRPLLQADHGAGRIFSAKRSSTGSPSRTSRRTASSSSTTGPISTGSFRSRSRTARSSPRPRAGRS
jgi:hypothetical protein